MNHQPKNAEILLIIVVMAIVAWMVPKPGSLWVLAWVLNMILMSVAFLLIGRTVNGKSLGILDDNNRMSLSRFQIALWTVLVVSALWTVAIARARDFVQSPNLYTCTDETASGDAKSKKACKGPADIELPWELWATLGMGIASAVAAPLIREGKIERSASAGRKGAGFRVSKEEEDAGFCAHGAVAVRLGKQPELADMFRSENVGSALQIDIGKVQKFFFTMVAVTVYGATFGASLSEAEKIADFHEFPILSEGLVAILGMSHIGYLAAKNVNPAPDKPNNNPAPGQPNNNPAPGQPNNDPVPGQPNNNPAPGQPNNNPASGQPNNNPAPGQPNNDPVPGQPNNNPAPGQPNGGS